jgi:hypothetical protein
MVAIGKASEVRNRILRDTSGIVIDQRMIPLIAFPCGGCGFFNETIRASTGSGVPPIAAERRSGRDSNS